MRLIKFRHKGLRRLYTKDDPKGVSTSHLDKVVKLLFALETALTLEQVGRFPGWKLHPLKGDMKGYWSLTHIIHEASAASTDTRLRRAVSPFSPSTYCTSMPQGFTPPSAHLASRLRAFATNLHE